jgi:hypothetical protein
MSYSTIEGVDLNNQLAERLAKIDISSFPEGNDQAMDVDTPEGDIQWQFVLRCLEYLKLIQRELNSKVDSEGMNHLIVFSYYILYMTYIEYRGKGSQRITGCQRLASSTYTSGNCYYLG